MPNPERIAIERARARNRLHDWQRAPLTLARPVYFVPGWTDELGQSAWGSRMEPWVAAVCANAATRSHFVEFSSSDPTRPPTHESFLGFGVDLARLVGGNQEALALGADFVFAGRPFLYAAAVGGEAGVRHAIELLASEVGRDMALLGVSDLSEVRPELLTRTRA